MPKRKLAILADALDNQRAGIHVFTREFVQALIAIGKGDEILLVREKYDPNLAVEQITVPNTRLPIGFASLRLFFLVPYLLRRKKVRAVFEPAHFGPFNLSAGLLRITMIHDLTPIIFPQYHRWHSQLLQRLFLPRILKNSNWIVANSGHTARDVAQHFPYTADKLSFFHLGINERFRPKLEPERIEAMGITSPYFLFVGTIEPRKQVDRLIRVFGRFVADKRFSQWQLAIAGGSGWKNSSVQEAIEQFPLPQQIKKLGFVSDADLPILYSHATALIYPSEYEGFGLPVIEAMACGTNVITADNSSLREVAGGMAYLFSTYEDKDLLRQMIAVASGKGARSSAALRAHAAQFSWGKFATAFWDAYQQKINPAF